MRFFLFQKRLISSKILLHDISTLSTGSPDSLLLKKYAFLKESKKILSYFHDIPLGLDCVSQEANMVVEVPRWSNEKLEISTSMLANPIIHDHSNALPRYVPNIFPSRGYIFNYGAFPQSWENSTKKDPETGLFGDNDPLDVCEIGSKILPSGSLKRVKILASLPLIDSNQLDWKFIVIATDDPLASKINSIDLLNSFCPGYLQLIKKWFILYKLPNSKKKNYYAHNSSVFDSSFAVNLLQNCHFAWKELLNSSNHPKNINLTNSSVVSSQHYVSDYNLSLNSLSIIDKPVPDHQLKENDSYSFLNDFLHK